MPGPATPFYNLTVPTVGGDSGIWGGELNLDLGTIDTQLGLPQPAAMTITNAIMDLSKATNFAMRLTGATGFSFASVPQGLPNGGTPVVGTCASIVRLLLIIPSGIPAPTFPASVSWLSMSGSLVAPAPPLTSAPSGNGYYLIEFFTNNGGTNWFASVLQDPPGTMPIVLASYSGVNNITSQVDTIPANTLVSAGDVLDLHLWLSYGVGSTQTVTWSWNATVFASLVISGSGFQDLYGYVTYLGPSGGSNGLVQIQVPNAPGSASILYLNSVNWATANTLTVATTGPQVNITHNEIVYIPVTA